jgi:hypothetical protein
MRVRSDMTELEARFHREALTAYMSASKACGYSEPRLLQMVHEYGAARAATVILRTNRFLYALAELGRCGVPRVPGPQARVRVPLR